MEQETQSDIAPMIVMVCSQFDIGHQNAHLKRDDVLIRMMAHKTPKDTATVIVMGCRGVDAKKSHVLMNLDNALMTMTKREHE